MVFTTTLVKTFQTDLAAVILIFYAHSFPYQLKCGTDVNAEVPPLILTLGIWAQNQLEQLECRTQAKYDITATGVIKEITLCYEHVHK